MYQKSFQMIYESRKPCEKIIREVGIKCHQGCSVEFVFRTKLCIKLSVCSTFRSKQILVCVHFHNFLCSTLKQLKSLHHLLTFGTLSLNCLLSNILLAFSDSCLSSRVIPHFFYQKFGQKNLTTERVLKHNRSQFLAGFRFNKRLHRHIFPELCQYISFSDRLFDEKKKKPIWSRAETSPDLVVHESQSSLVIDHLHNYYLG